MEEEPEEELDCSNPIILAEELTLPEDHPCRRSVQLKTENGFDTKNLNPLIWNQIMTFLEIPERFSEFHLVYHGDEIEILRE